MLLLMTGANDLKDFVKDMMKKTYLIVMRLAYFLGHSHPGLLLSKGILVREENKQKRGSLCYCVQAQVVKN